MNGFSQPVINSDVMMPVGNDSVIYHGALATDFDPGPDGADVFWDFSTYTGEPTMELRFDESNDCGTMGTYHYVYEPGYQWLDWWGESSMHTSERWFTTDESSFSFCKIGGLEFEMNFNAPFTQLIFPLTYGTENASNFTGTCFYGFGTTDTFPFSGSSAMLADAYGTLSLASGIYPDVLRVKVIDTMGCDYGRVDSYYWFKEGIKGPLFKYTKDYLWSYEYMFERKDAADVTGIENNELHLNMYPNPAAHYLIVSGLNSGAAEIYNVNGQFISSQYISPGENKVDLQNMANGIYILKIIQNDKVSSGIFEKKGD